MLSNIKITENEMKYISLLENMTGATIVDCIVDEEEEIFEYIGDAEKFIRNALKPARVKEIRLVDRVGGDRIAMVTVETKDKGIAIGKNGQNIKKIRFLAKRYFDLETIVIN
jgi:N utilization substance protein A